MSIKLNVHPWCENCPDFSPSVDKLQGYEFENQVFCATIVTCKNEERCLEIKKYLESGMEGEKKDD